jgi:hypothetical protein
VANSVYFNFLLALKRTGFDWAYVTVLRAVAQSARHRREHMPGDADATG